MILPGIAFLGYQKTEGYGSNYPSEMIRSSVQWFEMSGLFISLLFLEMSPASVVGVRSAAFPSIAARGSEMMSLSFTRRVYRLKRKEHAVICYYSEPGPNSLEICVHNWHANTRLMKIHEVP
jgi:hypothetical protein